MFVPDEEVVASDATGQQPEDPQPHDRDHGQRRPRYGIIAHAKDRSCDCNACYGHSEIAAVERRAQPMPDEDRPTVEIRRRVEHALGQPTTTWVVPDTGWTAADRHSVGLADGTRVFVKAATDDDTERWLRTEHLSLQHVPERFAPGIVAWIDEPGLRPILITEDLSRAHWPASHQGVNWRPGDIDLVLAAVADLSRVDAPHMFAPTARTPARWPGLMDGPARTAFLDLQLCSEKWLIDAAPHLVAAESRLDEDGSGVVHGDIRSDNICIDGDRVIFVDWSQTSRGSAEHDLAYLLPTLHLEGGGPPYDLMPTGAPWAAAGAAALAHRVGHDPLPDWLFPVMVRLIAIDLSWAASSLDIPPPDGIDWRSVLAIGR